jgi:hypothetical protein
VSILLGYGNLTFAPQKIYPTGSGPHGMAIADVNHDSRLDIAVSNRGNNNMGILLQSC